MRRDLEERGERLSSGRWQLPPGWDDGKERKAHQTPPNNNRRSKKVERKESSAPGRPQVGKYEVMVKGDKACSSGEMVDNSLCRRARKLRKRIDQM